MIRVVAAFGIFLVCLTGCAWPTRDQSTLKAIHSEARTLMAAHPQEEERTVSSTGLPRTIASLKPDIVSASSHGVTIVTKAYFDGGWGYYVPAEGEKPPIPERHRALGQGVYWFHPY